MPKNLYFVTTRILCALSFAANTSPAAAKKHPSCPAPQSIQSYSLTPLKIQAWLKTAGKNVRSVREFVCCLPEELRKSYVVGHSSLAAQNGTPDNPRVIMFTSKNKLLNSDPPELALSLNSGHASMNQADSVEMAYRDPATGELQFFDLDFKHLAFDKPLQKNPETCMNCHGNAGKVPPGGPKYIFDPFSHWPRFVGGTEGCSVSEDALQKIAEQKAVHAIKNKKQYECLDQSLLESNPDETTSRGRYPELSSKLAEFDSGMSKHQTKQSTTWARSLPEFEKYKYMLVAENWCHPFKLRDWMPKHVYLAKAKNLDIDARLQRQGDLLQVFDEAMKDEYASTVKIRAAQRRLLNQPELIGKVGIAPNMSALACSDSSQTSIFQMAVEQSRFSSKDFADRDPELLLALDSTLRNNPIGQSTLSRAARFFLEGEGHGTFMAEASFRPGDRVKAGLAELLSDEKRTSELGELFERKEPHLRSRDGPGETTPICKTEGEVEFCARNPKTLCEDLKVLSLNAFRDAPSSKFPTKAPGTR